MFDSIEQISEDLKNKKITKEELVKKTVEKSKEVNKKFNAFVTIIDEPKIEEKSKIVHQIL